MASKVAVTAKIPAKLAGEVALVALRERLSMDTVVKEGLKLFLAWQEKEDCEEYERAFAAWQEHVASGGHTHTREEVFGKV